jgi:hypothetical protein
MVTISVDDNDSSGDFMGDIERYFAESRKFKDAYFRLVDFSNSLRSQIKYDASPNLQEDEDFRGYVYRVSK